MLTPPVRERLARYLTGVFIDGMVPGAEVVLSIDGAEFTHIPAAALRRRMARCLR